MEILNFKKREILGYEINKNIPIPVSGIGRPRKYPFKEMNIGDSFIIYEKYSRLNMSLMGNAARNWSKKGNYGYKFTLKKTEDNKIRIWRKE